MHVFKLGSSTEASEKVASMVIDFVKFKPNAVIGLATGKTMELVYTLIIKKAESEGISFQNCYFFMLDEYCGLPENHLSSFKYYIKSKFLTPMKIKENQISFPPAHQANGWKSYEDEIIKRGGIDLQLLGIGKNGHIGFNEPGSQINSRTRFVELTRNTIESNQDQFYDSIIPTHALTMGIATILSSKKLIMIATGESKQNVIYQFLKTNDGLSCPAIFLKDHPDFYLILDSLSGAKIESSN